MGGGEGGRKEGGGWGVVDSDGEGEMGKGAIGMRLKSPNDECGLGAVGLKRHLR